MVSLPMYDAPRAALAAFWGRIRRGLVREGVDAPFALTEPADLDAHWRSPNLLLSQTCGLPFSTTLRDDVVLLGTPHYAAPGCEGPLYRSVVVVREDDSARTPAALFGKRAVVNSFGSNSGCSQLFELVAPNHPDADFFGDIVVSGSHLASMELVRSGRADVAAIDCVSFALAGRDRPEALAGLRIVGRSTATPGLPFIASKRLGPMVIDTLRAALGAAVRDPDLAGVRAALLISGLSSVPVEAYDACRHAAASVPRPVVAV